MLQIVRPRKNSFRRHTDITKHEPSLERERSDIRIDDQAKAMISDIDKLKVAKIRTTIVSQKNASLNKGKMIRVKKKESDEAVKSSIKSQTELAEGDSPLIRPKGDIDFGYFPVGRRNLKNLTDKPVSKLKKQEGFQEASKIIHFRTVEEKPKPESKACSLSPFRKLSEDKDKSKTPLRIVKQPTDHDSRVKAYNNYTSFIQRKKEARKTVISELMDRFKENKDISWSTEDSENWPNISEKLKIGFKLGQGGFGKVYEGMDLELQHSVAIKVIEKRAALQKPELRRLVESEIHIHSSLPEHENICKFYRVIEAQWQVSTRSHRSI